MSGKYKFVNPESVYFVTATVIDWIDVFTRNLYRDILLDSFRFCQKNQGLQIHAWVLMPNPRLTGRAGLSHDLFFYQWARAWNGFKKTSKALLH